MSEIYFDNAATTRTKGEVLETFLRLSEDCFANASSNHAMGSRALHLLERARAQIALSFHVLPQECIFTSGATEGNNLAIKGVSGHCRSWGRRLITTKAEHPSVLEVFRQCEKEGFEVVYLDYDKEGNLDFDQLEKALDSKTSLVSVMAVNNEIGTVFDLRRVFSLVSKSRAKLHVDATQAVGKEDLSSLCYDLLTFSGHKIGGIKGTGLLIKKKNVQLDSQILGGGQENGFRSGTSPVPLDCSLATALRLSLSSQKERRRKAKALNDFLRKELSLLSEVTILSPLSASPFILSFALLEHKGSIVSEALSQRGIYVSTRSACSSREEGYSYVVRNAGYDLRTAQNAIRLSFCGEEGIEEGEEFMRQLKEILATTNKER